MMNTEFPHDLSVPTQEGIDEPQPYPPSFLDRFMRSVQRLPVPYWLTYLLLFILQTIIFHILAWLDGWLPAYTFSPLLFLLPLWQWSPLAFVTHLNSISVEALSTFSPLLDVQPEKMRQLKYEFTTMPARSVIIAGVIWSGVYVISVYLAFNTIQLAYGFGSFFAVMIMIEGLVSFSIGSVIYYHSVRQILLVHRTVKMVKQFNLFQLDPVYAFSVVTSRTGIAWVLLISFTLLTFPVQLAAIPILIILIVQVVLVIAVFALPLRIVNTCLVAEKRRLLAELDQRITVVLARLHRSLDNNELGEMNQLSSAITGLKAERDILTRIPTWPWREGLLTGFLSIIVLPIILFLVQLVLRRWLGM